MASTTIHKTRRHSPPETIDETASKRTIPDQIDSPRLKSKHYKRYHRCQRWTHGRSVASLQK